PPRGEGRPCPRRRTCWPSSSGEGSFTDTVLPEGSVTGTEPPLCASSSETARLTTTSSPLGACPPPIEPENGSQLAPPPKLLLVPAERRAPPKPVMNSLRMSSALHPPVLAPARPPRMAEGSKPPKPENFGFPSASISPRSY